jgi:hypothetical protein
VIVMTLSKVRYTGNAVIVSASIIDPRHAVASSSVAARIIKSRSPVWRPLGTDSVLITARIASESPTAQIGNW